MENPANIRISKFLQYVALDCVSLLALSLIVDWCNDLVGLVGAAFFGSSVILSAEQLNLIVASQLHAIKPDLYKSCNV